MNMCVCVYVCRWRHPMTGKSVIGCCQLCSWTWLCTIRNWWRKFHASEYFCLTVKESQVSKVVSVTIVIVEFDLDQAMWKFSYSLWGGWILWAVGNRSLLIRSLFEEDFLMHQTEVFVCWSKWHIFQSQLGSHLPILMLWMQCSQLVLTQSTCCMVAAVV